MVGHDQNREETEEETSILALSHEFGEGFKKRREIGEEANS